MLAARACGHFRFGVRGAECRPSCQLAELLLAVHSSRQGEQGLKVDAAALHNLRPRWGQMGGRCASATPVLTVALPHQLCSCVVAEALLFTGMAYVCRCNI